MAQMVAERLVKLFSTGIRGTKVTALKGLSLSVEEGEVFGLLGPNGAGKTTAIKIFMGLLYPTSGRAEVLGRPPWDVSTKGRIGFLPEGPYFYDYLTGEEFLDFYGRLFDIEGPRRRGRIEELTRLVGLTEFKGMKLRSYSKGMLQRIGLAQALINDPELIVLDEPMAGLDPVGRKELTDIILKLKSRGKTIFFSSHILSDVERICDRVAIIDRGTLVYLGKVKELIGSQPRYYDVTLENRVTLRLEKYEDVQRIMMRGEARAVVPILPTLEELFINLIQRQ